jgi:hypothetical protein
MTCSQPRRHPATKTTLGTSVLGSDVLGRSPLPATLAFQIAMNAVSGIGVEIFSRSVYYGLC